MNTPELQREIIEVAPAFTPTHVWRWKACLPARFGQACRLIAYGGLNTCLVEFADGWKVVTSRWAVRRLAGANVAEPDAESE